MNYQFDSAELVSNSAYMDTDGTQFTDPTPFTNDGTRNLVRINENIELSGRFLSQELRLASTGTRTLDWLTGAFFNSRKSRGGGYENVPYIDTDLPEGITITGIPGEGGQGVAFRLMNWGRESQEKAVFGELTYHINDQFALTGGVRYSNIDTVLWNQDYDGIPGLFALLFPLQSGEISYVKRNLSTPDTQNVWTGKASLTFKPDDDHTFYALVSRGYRVGMGNVVSGPDPNHPEAFSIPSSFESDSLWNYELGAKMNMLDGRLSANIAVYYDPWTGIQLQGRRNTDFYQFVGNAGEAVAKGIEMEIKYLPTANLKLGIAVTLQHTRLTSLTDQESLLTGAREGDRLPGSPDFQIAGSAEYSWPVGTGEMYARVDAQHVGDSVNGVTNDAGTGQPNAAFAINEAYENVNASLGYTIGKWSMSMYVENLTDNDDFIITQNTPYTFNRYLTLRPRTAGFRISWDY